MSNRNRRTSRMDADRVRDQRAQDDRTVVFLGAGASRADGAPLQGELFRDYFRHYTNQVPGPANHAWDRELATFFEVFFGIDVYDQDSIERATFPTFEEVLGIIELADSQRESFRDWGTSHTVDAQQKPRLQHMHDILTLLIAEILDHKLRGNAPHHPRLVRSLEGAGQLRNTSFVSLNYDILIDNALLGLDEIDLDYAVEFMNAGRDWTKPRAARSIKLFKLHGSLNWLYCPTCRAMRITPREKGVCRLKWRPGDCVCSRCQTLAVPIIIPPPISGAVNLYLRQIWHAAEQSLLECRRIVFCGYSFPDADVHVRYLLKRVEVNGARTPDVFVVNEHAGKEPAAKRAEKDRYTRFFRDKAKVHWTELSFERFCENPTAVEGVTT